MKKIIALSVLLGLCLSQPVIAADKFATYREGLESPAYNFFAITPSNSAVLGTDYGNQTRALTFDGGPCVLEVLGINDTNTVTINGRLSGIDYPYRVKAVYNSTTCTNIIGLY